MPIYEYSCEKCGKITEAFQKMSDSPLTICESCNGPLQKLVSKNSFLLKGNGWFSSGYDIVKSPVASDDTLPPTAPTPSKPPETTKQDAIAS